MATWSQVRDFAEDCYKIVFKIQGYPSDFEIVLHTLLDLGHFGFLVEGVHEKVRPLSQATFDEITDAKVKIAQRKGLSLEREINIATDSSYRHLVKIVDVLRDQLHVVPDGGVNRQIWDEVLRVRGL